MVQTVKFSQFVQGGILTTAGRPVGLENGNNTIWDYTGGSGSGKGVTATITRPGNTLVLGNWVKIDLTGQYVLAQGDTPENAEVVGVVVEIITPNDTFVVQQSGYLENTTGIFAPTSVGTPFFLDVNTPGAMATVDATVNFTVSRPVYYPDSPSSGWVLPYRGQIVGGIPIAVPGGGGDSPSIVTVTQNGHGLMVGNWVRVATPILGQATYVRALGDTLENSQAVGVVIQVLNANQFVLQFSGFNTGAVTVDYLGNPLTPSTTYYLSPTSMGALTSVNPISVGTHSKPLYISERTTANGGVNTGYILPQRPLDLSTSRAIGRKIIQANAFVKGDWLYISADGVYSKGIATSLATSQVVGVVTLATVNDFYLQTEGYVDGVVTTDEALASIPSATVCYLSTSAAGKLSTVAPSAVGTFTKPCYVQETLATRTGIILPQRPLPQLGGGGGGGSVVQVLSYTNSTRQDVLYSNVDYYVVPFLTSVITPTSASSKIRLLYSIFASIQYSTYFFIFRDGVLQPAAPVGPVAVTQEANIPQNNTFMYIDSPGTTAPVTYEVRISSRAALGLLTAQFNYNLIYNSVSSWTLEEIS